MRYLKARKTAPFDPYANDDVRCPECGNEQADMGNGVQCEECSFGPMPTRNQREPEPPVNKCQRK